MDEFNLEGYLSNGVEKIVKGALKASLSNPKQSIFMAKYALASKSARKIRMEAEQNGEHIPPFLIASITSKCNLHCAGCYARSNHTCIDQETENQLTDMEWLKIFQEAKEIGIGFILLAGGEPFMRPDIIRAAGRVQDIIFPVFTNGTMMNKEYIDLFYKYRNLVPVLSIEGNQINTDSRRGDGVYQKLMDTMEQLRDNKILFGVSVTVTRDNLYDVTSKEFLDNLNNRGCNLIVYVEFVPIDKVTVDLAPRDEEREYLTKELQHIRERYDKQIFISFPGDEKTSGGCLAAGRGFFHINSHGGAEPCPFSPYSDTNLKNTTLRNAINSPLFYKLRSTNVLMEDHVGGCVLFEKEELVRSYLKS